jgi:uncharacterized protein (TIGR03083 family)
VNLGAHIAAERSEFVRLLEALSDDGLASPSLCEGWTVQDVAAHAISYDCIDPLRYGTVFVGSGFSLDRTNQRLIARWRHREGRAELGRRL